MIIGSAEYRFHLPRTAMAMSERASPYYGKSPRIFGDTFRPVPPQPYGRPDWDLIPKAFIDVGHTINNQGQFFETDDTLVGAGLGLEFAYKQNVNLRVDWGVALKSVGEPESVKAGSNRFHISFTVLY